MLQESVDVLVQRHFEGVTKFEKLFRPNLDGIERSANESAVSQTCALCASIELLDRPVNLLQGLSRLQHLLFRNWLGRRRRVLGCPVNFLQEISEHPVKLPYVTA